MQWSQDMPFGYLIIRKRFTFRHIEHFLFPDIFSGENHHQNQIDDQDSAAADHIKRHPFLLRAQHKVSDRARHTNQYDQHQQYP